MDVSALEKSGGAPNEPNPPGGLLPALIGYYQRLENDSERKGVAEIRLRQSREDPTSRIVFGNPTAAFLFSYR